MPFGNSDDPCYMLKLLFRIRSNQPHDNAYSIGQLTFFHRVYKFSAIFVGGFDGIIQGVTGDVFFLQNGGEALLFKGAGI